MADVFLSYSSKDRAAAQRVQDALSARGIDVFWDQETPPGQDWDTWIRAMLSACKVAVVLWSKTSVKSDNVRHEALVARRANKLLPAMIDSIEAEELPMGLYIVQAMNLTDWRDANSKGVAQLADAISARLGRPAAAKVAAATAATAAKAPSAGTSPKAKTTLALVAIAAVVGGVAWFMMQQQSSTPALPSDRVSGNEVFAQGDGAATAAPGAACLDGSVPMLRVCANGNTPIPPAPVLGGGSGPSAADTFSAKLAGRWNWDGLPCANGPNVTVDGGRIVFIMPDSRFVHSIESETAQQVLTRVLEPSFALGEQYALTPEYVATDKARNFNLVVENKTAGTRDIWEPCEP